jgi:hypothetical protein
MITNIDLAKMFFEGTITKDEYTGLMTMPESLRVKIEAK